MKTKRKTSEQTSNYRWIVAFVMGFATMTSFISLTSFSMATPFVAKSIGVKSTLVNAFGVDGFSIALFVAFFLGSSGFFDTRTKLGVLLAQTFLIVPQFLIPSAHSLWLLAILRFFQGLVIMMLALFSLQLSGWFKPSERAISLSFTMGAIPLGGAVGGILSSRLLILGWQEMYYVNALIMVVGAVTYFIFARGAKKFEEEILASKQKPHGTIWNKKMTWIMGFLPTPIAWSLFSMGGFLPSFGYHLGYKTFQIGNLIFVWGVTGAVSCFVGALIGDELVKGKRENDDIFHMRLVIMTVADVLVGIGALMIVFFSSKIFHLAHNRGYHQRIFTDLSPKLLGFFTIMVLLGGMGVLLNMLAARSKILISKR